MISNIFFRSLYSSGLVSSIQRESNFVCRTWLKIYFNATGLILNFLANDDMLSISWLNKKQILHNRLIWGNNHIHFVWYNKCQYCYDWHIHQKNDLICAYRLSKEIWCQYLLLWNNYGYLYQRNHNQEFLRCTRIQKHLNTHLFLHPMENK